MLEHAIRLMEESNALRQRQMDRDNQTLDLLVQEKASYQTAGTETSVTLTPLPQTSQIERIHAFYLGCVPTTDASLTSLITTGVTGYIRMGPVAINFNEPSVIATQQDIILRSDSTRTFHVVINTGDFPAGLTFYALLAGTAVGSEMGERSVLH